MPLDPVIVPLLTTVPPPFSTMPRLPDVILPEFVIAHPEVPWLDMRDMRNKMIHAYFDVKTVKDDLPRGNSRLTNC